MDKYIQAPITKEVSETLRAGDYIYITGNKDWFIAVDYDYKIISSILPYDKRAVIEYENAINTLEKNIPKLKKRIKN